MAGAAVGRGWPALRAARQLLHRGGGLCAGASVAGGPVAHRRAEVTSDVKRRPEGVRIKHRVNSNSVKAYDKAYTVDRAVLRGETTLNDVPDLKVYRPKEGGPEAEKEWRAMRKGVADLQRRAQ